MLLQAILLAMAGVMDPGQLSPFELEALDRLRNWGYVVSERTNVDNGHAVLYIGGWKASKRGKEEMSAIAVLAPRIVKLNLCLVPIDDRLEWLSGATQLKHVNLSASSLTDEQLHFFPKLDRLELLALTKNNVSDEGLKCIRNIEIDCLGLAGTNVTADGLRQLRAIETLDCLILDQTKIDDGIWDVLGRCKRDRWLERISLDSTHVTGRGVSALKGIQVSALSLRRTSFTNEACQELAESIAVGDLDLSDTVIDDEGLKALGKMRSLGALRLNNTNVTDDGLQYLEDLPELQELYLHGTKVTVEGVEGLRKSRQRLPARIKEKIPGLNLEESGEAIEIHWDGVVGE